MLRKKSTAPNDFLSYPLAHKIVDDLVRPLIGTFLDICFNTNELKLEEASQRARDEQLALAQRVGNDQRGLYASVFPVSLTHGMTLAPEVSRGGYRLGITMDFPQHLRRHISDRDNFSRYRFYRLLNLFNDDVARDTTKLILTLEQLGIPQGVTRDVAELALRLKSA
ncbi:hypothetical protein RCL1_000661 [Eukaryota sp. TZLM3-RCL]